jgi:hypothetical protein
MKAGLITTILGSLFLTTSLSACVTYCPETGNYWVDKSGCVKER